MSYFYNYDLVTLIESKWNLLCEEITRWSKLLGQQQMFITPQP